MATGDIVKLGTLYAGSNSSNLTKQLRPTRPWDSDSTIPGGGSLKGNIPWINTGADCLEIRDTDTDDAYKIQWVEVNDGDKKLLIADRNILVSISQVELNEKGLLKGKNIVIDGQEYIIRTLTGGNITRNDDEFYKGGSPSNNEWDKYIANESNMPGLPTPTSTDLDVYQNSTDLGGTHNQLWNWLGCFSWSQETQKNYDNAGVYRGNRSPRFWYSNGTTARDRAIGWRPVLEVLNAAPTISGSDEHLGDKNAGFNVTYQVDDTDTADTLTVKEKINGVLIKTRNNAPRKQDFTVEITEEMLFSYSLLANSTIEIEVDDGKGQSAYRRYTFRRTNTAPKINGTDTDLGEKTEGFDITFSATDQENDTMSAKIFINDKLVETYPSIESGQEYIYSLSKLDFVQLDNKDEHKIRIEVQDHNNATSIRNYTFTRKVGRIMYAFEKETDVMATQVLVSPTWSIAEGAVAQVLVCNNAYDVEPAWEDATEQILLERHFNFTNDAKTDDNWGVGVQISIEKGTATELSFLAGFGGAFK